MFLRWCYQKPHLKKHHLYKKRPKVEKMELAADEFIDFPSFWFFFRVR